MNKTRLNKIKIELPREDAALIKEILEIEESNVEAHRLARKGVQKSEYEKQLERLTEELAAF